MADTKILLDSTQGELEILEFIVNDVRFGINVAKVQEIVVKQKVTPIPSSAFGIRGIFNIRDGLYSVIDLGLVLFNRETELTNKTYYIAISFSYDLLHLTLKESKPLFSVILTISGVSYSYIIYCN